MADSPKEQLEALKREIGQQAPLSPDPLLASTAQQGRAMAGLLGNAAGDQLNTLSAMVRERPITTVLAAFFASYALGRIGRWL